jgi:hypothetical protein
MNWVEPKILGARRKDPFNSQCTRARWLNNVNRASFHPHSRADVTADCSVYSTNITNVYGSRWETVAAA